MSVRIESIDRLSVGDTVDRDGGKFVVTDATVWTDGWGEYALTVATLEPVGGADVPGED